MRSISLLLVAILCAACGPRPLPMPPSPALDPSTPPPAQPPRQVAAEDCRCIRICFVRNGELREVGAVYVIATRDTLTEDSLPFSSLAQLTGEYASVAGWYVQRDTIRIQGRPFAQYGMPRVLGIDELERAGEYRGVGVYVDAEQPRLREDIVYLPFRPGCAFQPYRALDAPPPGRP